MGIPNLAQPQGRLGRYELLARLATGGMGEIFLARLEGAEGFEKLFVIKRILPHLADDARFRQMLIAEARIASRMSHANICQVYELGETEGQLYIVMEYLEGVSLLPLLRRASKENAQLDFGLIANVVQQATDALNYAHDLKDRDGDNLGIIHRDVTPSNIFLTDSGVAKVLDFGIAKAKGSASTQTQEGTVKGKYAYMAPEQLRGASIDRRVDVFAMGVVLYEMLALRRLFQRKTDYLTFRAVMEQPIPDIRRYRADVPDALADAVARALERDPDKRFDTARLFGSAILDAVSSIKRPWTQGEVSDFVRHNFADEIGKRSQQVASVVGRTAPGTLRATMPLIVEDDALSEGGDADDEEFPSVETEVEGVAWRAGSPRTGMSGDFATSGTPPPFSSGESTASAPSLQPLNRGSGTQPYIVTVPQQRSLLWPVLAVAMVVIAGGALFLVWRQMQQQPQPSVVNITQSNDDRAIKDKGVPAPAPRVDDRATEPAPPGPGPGPARAPTPAPVVRVAHKKVTYDSAVADKKADMVQCLGEHRDSIPRESIAASIKIGASGRAMSVTLTPESLNTGPLGACLRNVLMAASFPTGRRDTDITVPLKPTSN